MALVQQDVVPVQRNNLTTLKSFACEKSVCFNSGNFRNGGRPGA
ncbi:MAG: hypothetical protein RI884_1337, partial [Pseudomonadota bacterium]